MVVISDDGVDEHEHIVEIVEKLYQSGEFANPAIKEDGEYEDNRIVKVQNLKVIINHSKNDFIRILFRAQDLNYFIQQILLE